MLKKNHWFNLVSGGCSILGFIISFIIQYKLYRIIFFEDFKGPDDAVNKLSNLIPVIGDVFIYLAALIVVLAFVTLFVTFFYTMKLKAFSEASEKLDQLTDHLIKRDLLLKELPKNSHTIWHYLRNLSLKFDTAIEKYRRDEPENQLEHAECNEITKQFNEFLNLLHNNIKNYLDLISDDSCSVCIKLYNETNGHRKVKTFFRDNINYRIRKKADFDRNGRKAFDIANESSLKMIVDKEYQQKVYARDDLQNSDYQNQNNPQWGNFYNATIIVPISRRVVEQNSIFDILNPKNWVLKDRSEIMGFLCADNMKGGLAKYEVKEFMCSMADSLYLLFKKYEAFCSICREIEYADNRVEAFLSWK